MEPNQMPPTQQATAPIQTAPPAYTPAPTPAGASASVTANKSSIGSIVGTIIIIALIILGGLYFWGKHVKESKTAEILTSETSEGSDVEEDNEAAAIRSTSSSDDLDSIDADLQATNTTDLDAEADPQLQ